MTKPYEKPNHHLVPIIELREWRTRTKTDKLLSICAYCDEDTAKTQRLRCTHSCGTRDIWVNIETYALMALEDR